MVQEEKKTEKKRKRKDNGQNTIVTGTILESKIQKTGEAASQVVQAFTGIRVNSEGHNLNHKGRSLKKISNYKLNENYKELNILQQAGFVAELLEESRSNKENILKERSTRKRTTDGLGLTNHQKYDHVIVDENNKIIKGSGTQMKFLSKKLRVIDKLAKDKSWDRYDVVQVPKGEIRELRVYAKKRASSLREQAKRLKLDGKTDLAKQKLELAERYENAGKRVKNSKVTHSEAVKARKNPERFVTEEVLLDSHKAGQEAVKEYFVGVGLVSLVSNSVAVARGEKDSSEALLGVGKDLAVASANNYVVTASGTALKSVMHASKYSIIREASKAAGTIVGSSIEIGKSIVRFAKGEIDDAEFVEELGEKGVAAITVGYFGLAGKMIGSAFGSLLPGGMAVGGIIGEIIGGMIGYSFSSLVYHGILEVFKKEKIERERREYLERLCEDMIRANTIYQMELEEFARKEAAARKAKLDDIFRRLAESIWDNDIEQYAISMHDLGTVFGVDLKFMTFKEFQEKWNEPLYIEGIGLFQ